MRGDEREAIARAGVDLDDLPAEFVRLLEDQPGEVGGVLELGDDDALDRDAEPAEDAAPRALAGCPNVFVKLGGLGMRLFGFDFAERERPRMVICGGSSYPRTIDFGRFREAADSVGALLVGLGRPVGLRPITPSRTRSLAPNTLLDEMAVAATNPRREKSEIFDSE